MSNEHEDDKLGDQINFQVDLPLTIDTVKKASGVALAGGANNAKLAAAATIPVSLNATMPVTGNIEAHFGSITANFGSLGMLTGAIASEVAGKLSGQLRTGMSSPSGTGFNSGAHAPTTDMGPYGPSY
jgi:hypothetical protein